MAPTLAKIRNDGSKTKSYVAAIPVFPVSLVTYLLI